MMINRLSFLQGNYVTLTNMSDEDAERIIRYNLPRVNISVHTTNPELRKKMLHNKRAGEVLKYLKLFADGGLNMNAQIVLCPGYNDKAELDRTLNDLGELGYSMESISIVPVGLSAYREGLDRLTPFKCRYSKRGNIPDREMAKKDSLKDGERALFILVMNFI